jgi:hypothetical protein
MSVVARVRVAALLVGLAGLIGICEFLSGWRLAGQGPAGACGVDLLSIRVPPDVTCTYPVSADTIGGIFALVLAAILAVRPGSRRVTYLSLILAWTWLFPATGDPLAEGAVLALLAAAPFLPNPPTGPRATPGARRAWVAAIVVLAAVGLLWAWAQSISWYGGSPIDRHPIRLLGAAVAVLGVGLLSGRAGVAATGAAPDVAPGA